MRKKSFLVAIPAGLLVLGMILAGCDHGPAPTPVQTSGISATGDYTSVPAGTQLQYAQDGVVRKRTNKDVEWESIYPIFQNVKLSVPPLKFNDITGEPLGEMAFILSGNSPAGIVVQVYDTEMGKLSGSVGVWIGIGQGTASLVNGMMPLKSFMSPAGTSSVDNIASTQASGSETFYGKK
jgi:hypothetical protein